MANSIFISDAIKNKPKGLIAMGYSYDIKDAISHLQKPEDYGEAPTENSITILGLGSTHSSSIDVKRFSGQFSDDDYLWRVELSYTQVLPMKKNENSNHFLAYIKGETQHSIFSNFGFKVIPGKLDEDNYRAAYNALGDKGFKVGCLLDMNSTGVEYLNRFFKMVSNLPWESGEVMSLVNAGCLYAEFISGEAGRAIPIPIIGNIGPAKSSQIKIVSALAASSHLKDLKLPFSITSTSDSSNSIDIHNSSDYTYPCMGGDYDYLKGEIMGYDTKSFNEWKNNVVGNDALHYINQPPKMVLAKGSVISGDYYVRLFIPEVKKQDAEYALSGTDKQIPLELFKTSSQINYTPGKIVSTQTAEVVATGDYSTRAEEFSRKVFSLCNGMINSGLIRYGHIRGNFGNREANLGDKGKNPHPVGSSAHELYKLLKYANMSSQSNAEFEYDCSAFAQMMLYNSVGLKSENTIIPGLSGTGYLVGSGASVINKYINPNYEAVSIPFDINNLKPGDLLVRDGHAAFFVGPNGYPGAGPLATIESHGSRSKTLRGSVKAGKPYKTIIRVQRKNLASVDNNTNTTS